MSEQPQPIFVCGAGRSGTTMLGAMLGRHPECLAVPEATFVAEALRRCHPVDEAAPRDLLRFVTASARHRIWESPVDVDAVPDADLAGGLADVVRVVVAAFGRTVERSGYTRWIDHTPLNVRHSAALFRLFPDAHMIHLVRDGRAVAASVLPLDWGANDATEAARGWMLSLAHGFAAAERHGARRVRRVRYEDVLRAPERTLRGICSWAGLPYDDALVTGEGGLRVPRYTREQHALVGGPPDASRVEAWRDALSPRQIELFEAVAAEMLEHLGYEPVHGPAARNRTRGERRRDVLRGLWRREVTDRRRRSKRWRR